MTSVKPKNIKATVSGTKGTQEAHIETKEVDIDVKITPVKKAVKETKPAVKAAPKAPVKAASKATKPAAKPAAKTVAVKSIPKATKLVVPTSTVASAVPAQVIPEAHAHAEVKPVSAQAIREAIAPAAAVEVATPKPFHPVMPPIDVEIVPHTHTVYHTMPGIIPSAEETKERERAIQQSVDTTPPFSLDDVAKVPKYVAPPRAPLHHNTVSIDQVKNNIQTHPMTRSTDAPATPPVYHREPIPTTSGGKLSMDTLKDRMRHSIAPVPVKRF